MDIANRSNGCRTPFFFKPFAAFSTTWLLWGSPKCVISNWEIQLATMIMELLVSCPILRQIIYALNMLQVCWKTIIIGCLLLYSSGLKFTNLWSCTDYFRMYFLLSCKVSTFIAFSVYSSLLTPTSSSPYNCSSLTCVSHPWGCINDSKGIRMH